MGYDATPSPEYSPAAIAPLSAINYGPLIDPLIYPEHTKLSDVLALEHGQFALFVQALLDQRGVDVRAQEEVLSLVNDNDPGPKGS